MLTSVLSMLYVPRMQIEDVIRHFGGRAQVAKALGLTDSAVYQWRKRVPLLRQMQIEAITDGALRVQEIPIPKRANEAA